MAEYRFALIFDLERHLRNTDTTRMFDDVNHLALVEELIEHLTNNVFDIPEAREAVNEVEYLMSILYEKNIIKEYFFQQNEPYVKTCAILFAVCESIVDMFDEVQFYKTLERYDNPPVRVHRVSRKNFAIMVKRK